MNNHISKLSAALGLVALQAFLQPAPAALLKVIDFETGNLSQISSQEVEGPSASVTASTVVARRGLYSLKSYMTNADKRAEVVSLRGTVGGTHWYGWSIYAPTNYLGDGSDDIVSQFHDWHSNQPAWSKDGVAPTSFTFRNGGIGFGLKYQVVGQNDTAHNYYSLGPYTPGTWHDIVVQVKWTHLTSGFMKIWVNGVLKLDYTGPTYMNYGAGNGPYFKMGNYKGIFNWTGASPRIFYMDEFRMGDSNSSYAEVDPNRFWEVENITVTSASDSITGYSEASASGGAGEKLNANATGDFISYTVPNVAAGTFPVKVRIKKYMTRGTFQLSIDGVNHGPPQDLYSATPAYIMLNLGNKTFSSAGSKVFKFTVVGKNASSSGYDLALDYIVLQ